MRGELCTPTITFATVAQTCNDGLVYPSTAAAELRRERINNDALPYYRKLPNHRASFCDQNSSK